MSKTKELTAEEQKILDAEQAVDDAKQALAEAEQAHAESLPAVVIPMVRVATKNSIQGANVIGGITFRWPVILQELPDVDPTDPAARHNTVHCSMPKVMVEEHLRDGKIKVVGKLPDLVLAPAGENHPDHVALAAYMSKYPVKTEFLTPDQFKVLKPKRRKQQAESGAKS